MKIIIIIITTTLTLLFSITGFTQNTAICFSYDNAGNRTGKIACPKAQEEVETSEEDMYSIGSILNDDENQNIASNDSEDLVVDMEKFSMEFYPNPVTSSINLRIEGSNNNFDVGEIRIYNSQGQLIKSETFSDNSSEFDVNELAPGIYVLKATYGDITREWQFVKQN